MSSKVSRDLFAKCFFDSCDVPDVQRIENTRMRSLREWTNFQGRLVTRGLIDDTDVPKFNEPPKQIHDQGGLDIFQFQAWITEKYFGASVKGFEKEMDGLQASVHQMNAAIQHWGLETLNQRELYTLQVLFEELEHAGEENLRYLRDRAGAYRQETMDRELQQTLSKKSGGAAARGSGAPLPTTPEEYQWERGAAVERRLRDVKIAAVYFREPRRIISKTDWGLMKCVGYNMETEEEVEVTEVPWEVPFEFNAEVERVMDQMEALKQLALSRYFPDYLGYDYTSYTSYGLHFLPPLRGISLRALIFHGGGLNERTPLLRYWCREVLRGMRDYLYQCCQELTEDITLENAYVCDDGLKIIFQNMPFSTRRGALYEDAPDYGPANKWRNGFVPCETRLIGMFGAMVLELLYGEAKKDSPIPTCAELCPALRSLVYLCCNARDTLDVVSVLGDRSRRSRKPLKRPAQQGAEAPHTLPVVSPNLEGTPDEPPAGAPPTMAERAVDSDEFEGDAAHELRPNEELFTLQELLDNPYFAEWDEPDAAELMDQYEVRFRKYVKHRAEYVRLESFLERGG